MIAAGSRRAYGAVVAVIGLLLLAVPAFDIYDDFIHQNEPLVTTIVENFPLLALAGGIIVAGVWLAWSNWRDRYARTVARLTAGTAIGVALLIALVVVVQFYLQGELKPLIIAADAVVIGTVGGVLIGVRTAQQQRAVDEAKRQRNRATALFENHTDAVAFIGRSDGDAVVTEVNEEFERVFGQSHEDIGDVGTLVPEVDGDATDMSTEDTLGDVDGNPVRREVTYETPDGEQEFIRQTVPVDVTSDGASEAYVVFTDITDQKEREHQLEFLNSLLRHDIQNGMTVIRSRAEYLRERLTGREAEFAATIEERSDDIVDLTDQFRVMLDALIGAVDEELGPVELATVVDEQIDVLKTSFPTVEATVDVPDVTVRADELFSNVVWNLLSNAVEHNNADTPQISVTAEEQDDDMIRIEFADNGPGIPDDLKDAVFRRDESGVRNEVGSGFGLFFVEQMVSRYSGSVRAEDNDPDGTVFVVHLPKPTP